MQIVFLENTFWRSISIANLKLLNRKKATQNGWRLNVSKQVLELEGFRDLLQGPVSQAEECLMHCRNFTMFHFMERKIKYTCLFFPSFFLRLQRVKFKNKNKKISIST